MNIEEIVNKASTAQRYEILELCLDIVGADNKAEKSELDIVNNLSKLLEIDQGKFNKMKERQLPIKMHVEKDDPCSIVGVTSEMSSEEIRIHINSEYSKWNRRTTNTDPKIREQADEMLMLIAECRKKHHFINVSEPIKKHLYVFMAIYKCRKCYVFQKK